MSESLKQRLQAGHRLVVFATGRMSHPNIINYLGMTGDFDGFWIDVEHAGFSVADIEVSVAAGRAHGLECLVRVPPTDYATVTRCFESGAVGVMAAQISSAAQAEEFVQWSKFAPRGRRGLNPLGYDGGYGTIPMAQFTARANEETVVGIQIETAQAVAEVEDIAAIDGVDFLFVGPSDLSQAMGVVGDFLHPRCIEAVDKIADACGGAGKRWGAVMPTPEYAALLIDKGCTLISVTNDVKLITSGLEATKGRFSFLWP
jgi:2-dehydro-3-deoxyglucarate aldolase/4-hydroxy-2-oxoheptanedioate aldolase